MDERGMRLVRRTVQFNHTSKEKFAAKEVADFPSIILLLLMAMAVIIHGEVWGEYSLLKTPVHPNHSHGRILVFTERCQVVRYDRVASSMGHPLFQTGVC